MAQGAKTNKRRTLLALLLAVSIHPSVDAQQGWSPQPFVANAQVRPLASAPATSATPANRLRGESTPSDDTPVGLRWKSPSKSQPIAIPPSSTVFEESQVVASLREMHSKAPFNPTQPTSNPTQPTTNVAQSPPNVKRSGSPQLQKSLAPSAYSTNQNAVTPAATWTDRSSPQSNRVVRSVVEPEPFQHQWNERSNPPVSVALAQFDVPPTGLPNADTPKDAFESNLLPPDRPPTMPSNDGTRSLIDPNAPSALDKPPETPPNPFPKPDKTDSLEWLEGDKPTAPSTRDRSPSDLELTPSTPKDSGRSGSSRLSPSKSKATKRPEVTCDQVRDRVLSANIGTIELDVAPDFGVGPKDKQSAEQKRSAYALSASSRSWHNLDGSVVIDGRLVDISHDSIVLETSNGTRSRLALRELSEPDKTYVYEAWGLPQTCSLGSKKPAAREFEATTVGFKASGLCHKPLYFEEIQLERSGHELGPIVQPVVSTAHFFKNVAFLPYKMGIHPLTECQYALGHYRPGNCAPWSIEPIPLSLRGAATQATVITGAVLVLP